MEERKYVHARIAYSHSWNLGDHIQSLATEQFLNSNPLSVERHELNTYQGTKVLMLLQGYFFKDEYHCTFPPSENILPLFIGFHIEDAKLTRERYSSPDIIHYLKKFEPIGCRDNSTKLFVEQFGIDAYLSRCLTLTFPTRKTTITRKEIFFIDTPEWLKPNKYTGKIFNKIYKNAVFLTQVIDEKEALLSDNEKRLMAIDRITLLREKAKLVVTSRLHIAAPCLAMGIPIILIPREATPVRYEAIQGLMPIYYTPTKHFKIFGKNINKIRQLVQLIYIRFIINWNPQPININKVKEEIISNTISRIESYSYF